MALALLLPALLAGCTGPGAGPGSNASDGGIEALNCEVQTGSTQRTAGVSIACQNVSVSGSQREDFECTNPAQSAIRVATNLSAGSLDVRATDGAGDTLFDRTYERIGPYNETVRIDEGEQGFWTLRTERGEAFNGSFGVRLACAR